MFRTSFLLVLTTLLFAACKKNTANKTTCTSTLYGYKNTYVTPPLGYIDGSSSFGIINQSTAVMGVLSSASYANDGIYDNHAAFNTADNCYYVFKHDWFASFPHKFDTLLKVSTSGAVTFILPPSPGTSSYRDVIYSQVTNKLYCIKDFSLCELSVSAGSFTTTPITTDTVYIASAIDNAGYIYYLAKGKLRKILPGSLSTVIAPVTARWLWGLCYNNNDNKLYCIRQDTTTSASIFDFVRIDPASGSVTSLSPIGSNFNYEFYSAIIDECSNRYILSSVYGSLEDSSYLKQISMTGTVVQNDVITGGVYLDLALH